MNSPIDQVYDQLWIGNIRAAQTHSMSEFDVVITVCQDSVEDHIPNDATYHFFEMSDGPDNAYGGRSDYEFFSEAASTVLGHLEDGDDIFVHCHAGQSRSASVSIAALGVYHELSYYEVYNNVESQRPQIHPDSLLEQHAKQFIEERTDISHIPFGET